MSSTRSGIDFSMSSVLVTGASGFIGRHLVPALRAAGHDVLERDIGDGDIADERTWAAWPRTDIVVHLAGRLSVPESWADPSGFARVNLVGTVAALGFCQRHGAGLVFMSSYLYGNPSVLPIPETAPVVATNPYALSKKLAESACRFFSDHCGVDVTILRPFNVYGPGQAGDFVIPSIVRLVKEGREIRVRDLRPRRDYVYVTDVVRAIVMVVGRRQRFCVLNVGSGVSHSVVQVIAVIQGIMGTALPVCSDAENRKYEIMDTIADVGEARRQLGWVPEWTLTEGLRRTCEHRDPPVPASRGGGRDTRGDGVDDV